MNPSVRWAMAQGLITLRDDPPFDALEYRRNQIRESMRRQRERRGVSASATTGIRREAFPEGPTGLRLFHRALRFYWAARGHVRKSKVTA